jgi:hypothetical protein
VSRATQGLDAVANCQRGGLPEGIDSGNHRVPIEHSSDVVGNGGGEFAAAQCREFRKNRVAGSSPDVSESVAVEKKKRGGPVEVAEEVERLEERGVGQAESFPVTFARASSL